MKKINLMIGLILIVLLSSIVFATVTHTLNNPANLVSNQSTSFIFNWTPASNSVAGNLTSWLMIDGVVNQTITKTNGTSFNTTVSGFAVGFHPWNVTTNDTGGNFTSDTRWFEVTTDLNESYFNWKSSGGSVIMNLHKTTGDLNITGIFNAASGSTSAVNWTQLQNYPAACSSGFAVTAINDSTTCTAFLLSTGGTLTGNTALTGNNLTNISYINPGDEDLTIGNNLIVDENISVNKIDTGNGFFEVYNMDQNVTTADAVTFATVDTGQGANELYDMDQNVLTTSNVLFVDVNMTNLRATNLESNIDGTGFNITGDIFKSGANVGITGNFTLNQSCWIDFNGGLATATNCTAN